MQRWVNLEAIIQSEVDDEEKKQIIHINAYKWNLERWYWLTYWQGRNRDADMENRLMDTAVEGEGGTSWESSVETCALPYVKLDSQWKFVIDRGSSDLKLCDNLSGGMGWEGWMIMMILLLSILLLLQYSRRRGLTYTCGWLMLIYGRNQHNSVKQLSSN